MSAPVGDAYAAAEDLEARLGDPHDAANPLSFAEAMELDEREELPTDGLAALDAWGFHRRYIPASLGGAQGSFEEVLALNRVVSRRDLTAAIAHGKTYLGLVPVWAAGLPEQTARLATIAGAGAPVCLGLTERDHGSDLVATDTRADRIPGGYALTGEKWLINNGTRSRVAVILARTDPRSGPRAHSLFMIDKERLAPGALRPVPKIRTLGIRGADISGFTLDRAEVPDDALVGAPGAGLETVMRVTQTTRVLCAGFSLGAADTALRCVLDFAAKRVLYGQPVLRIPHVRRTLLNAFADLMLADAAAIVGARMIQAAPEELSVGAAIVKYFVPATVEALIRDVAVILGARYYLRERHWHGVFQKLSRDAAVVSLFDGSTVVNLNALGLQLRYLAACAADTEPDGDHVEALFRLSTPLPPVALGRLALASRGRDTVVQSLRSSTRRLLDLERRGEIEGVLAASLGRAATRLHAEVVDMSGALDTLETDLGVQFARAPETFALAKRYATIFAAAATLGLWLHNRDSRDGGLRSGGWVALCLHRASGDPGEPPRAHLDDATALLDELTAAGRAFSFAPFLLARPAARPRHAGTDEHVTGA
jgi:alkylation response protein AidB-like acyl-CoA dehydrogenase